MGRINADGIFTEFEKLMQELDLLVDQRFVIKNNDLVDITIKVLTQRILNGYKATKLLIRYGFNLEASTIVRSVIESVLVFNSIMEKPKETLLKLEQLANHNKIKLQKQAHKYHELMEKVKKFDFTDLDSKKAYLADFAELSPKNTQLYELAYVLLCDEVHLNQASLEKFLMINDNVISGIKSNHDAEDFDITYFILFHYCLHPVLTDLSRKYALGLDSQLVVMKSLLERVDA